MGKYDKAKRGDRRISTATWNNLVGASRKMQGAAAFSGADLHMLRGTTLDAIADGATGTVTLAEGGTVEAINDWTGSDIAADEKVWVTNTDDGVWRVILIAGSSTNGGDCCDIVCCDCELKTLYVDIENTNISYRQLSGSNVSGGTITHRIELTCGADGATRIVPLEALSCSTTDCKTLDMSGEFVGVCEIGEISYGNSSTCAGANTCSNLPPHSKSGSGVLDLHSSVGRKYGLAGEQLFVIYPERDRDNFKFDANMQITSTGANNYIIALTLSILNGYGGGLINVNIIGSSYSGDRYQCSVSDSNTGPFNGQFDLGPIDGSAHDLSVEASESGLEVKWDDETKVLILSDCSAKCTSNFVGAYNLNHPGPANTSQLALNTYEAKYV